MSTITAKDGTQIFRDWSSKIMKKATLKIIKGAPHGMCTTHRNVVNEDLLGFLKA